MERLRELIGKLNEQSEQNETALQMLVTLKQIEAELTQIHTVAVSGRKNPGVSVVMPSMAIHTRAVDPVEEKIVVQQEKTEPVSRPRQAVPAGHHAWMGDPMIEIPTLSHQPGNKEINDLLGGGSSLNDKLKSGSP